MKVNIGKYLNYFGPYQLAHVICFWAKDKEGNYPEYVHNLGEILAHGNLKKKPEIGEIRNFHHERNVTYLCKFLDWLDSFKERKVTVRIDHYDTFNLDHTLALVIHPALKEFRKNIYSYPDNIDQNDVPEELRIKEDMDTYEKQYLYEKQWNYIIDEMIFAFQMKITDDWEDEFCSGQSHLQLKTLEDGLSEVIHSKENTFEIDFDGMQKVQKRIDNGLLLFGKYYGNLWN